MNILYFIERVYLLKLDTLYRYTYVIYSTQIGKIKGTGLSYLKTICVPYND